MLVVLKEEERGCILNVECQEGHAGGRCRSKGYHCYCFYSSSSSALVMVVWFPSVVGRLSVSNGSVPPFHSQTLMVPLPGENSLSFIPTMLSRNASCPVEFVLKNTTPVPLPVPSGFIRLMSTKVVVAFSCSAEPSSPSVTIRLCPLSSARPLGRILTVVFAVSVAFIVIVAVAFGGINVTLCRVDISM